MHHQKERMNGLLYLEFDRKKASEIFTAPGLAETAEELFVPINPEFLVQRITENLVPRDLPVAEFIIGMAFALAVDPDFKYAAEYRAMLKGYEAAEPILKSKIAGLYDDGRQGDAYILIKALYEIAGDEETENILLSTGEELALKDPQWGDEVLEVTDLAIDNGNANGYLIRGSLLGARGDETGALTALRAYVTSGGELTAELAERLETLDRDTRAETAYQGIFEDPTGSLKALLELYPLERANPRLIYSIAVCYRLLGNHEKAIFYLEEAQALDPGYVDVLNELGLNYALINDYMTARDYFRAVFKATREVEPMTNLILSLFQTGETGEAMELYRQAAEIAPEDEILREIRRVYLD